MTPEHQDEEGDVCRVCRSGPEPDQPLFHPCKCAGSIRFVHQDCLMTWLQSSKRKYCELCGHNFSFTRVYDPTMPEALPPLLFAYRVVRQLGKAVLLGVRSLLVGLTWLGLVPWLTIWTFRLYFVLGNGIAWTMTGQPRPAHLFNLSSAVNSSSMASGLDATSNGTVSSLNSTSTSRFFIGSSAELDRPSVWNHALLVTVAKDTFEGQILTASIVISFLAAFLLREWTLQAPPREEPAEAQAEMVAMRAAVFAAANPPNLEAVLPVPIVGPLPLAEPARVPVGALRVDLGEDPRPTLAETIDQMFEEDEEEAAEEEDQEEQEMDQESLRRAREAYFAKAGPAGPDRIKRVPTSLSPKVAKLRHLQRRRRARDPDSSSTESSPLASFDPLPSPSRDSGPDQASSSTSPRIRALPLRQSPKPDDEPPPDMERSSPPTFYTRHSASSNDDASEIDATKPSASGSNGTGRAVAAPPSSDLTFRATSPPSPEVPYRRRPRPAGVDVRRNPFRAPSPTPLRRFARSPDALESRRALEPDAQDRALPDVPVDVGETDADLDLRPMTVSAMTQAMISPDEASSTLAEPADETEWVEEDEVDDGNRLPPLVAPLARRAELVVAIPEQNDVDEDDDEEEEEEEEEDDDGLRDEELEAANDRMLEEDLEGILEAIGLRGPVLQLLQNSALMSLVLSTCVAVTIFIPFTLGKTLLLLNLLDVFRGFRLPVKAVRLATDPVLRIGHRLGAQYLFPYLDAALLPVIQLLEAYLPAKSPARLPTDPLPDPSAFAAFFSSAQSHLLVRLTLVEESLGRALTSSDSTDVVEASPAWSWVVDKAPVLKALSLAVSKLGGEVGDLFALIGVAVRDASDWVKLVISGQIESIGFASLAQGDTSADRFFAVWVGYSTVAMAVLLWFITSSDTRGLSQTVKEVFKQNGVVVKLAFFMSIELIIFPLGCGILLDICLLPLFPDAGLARAAFHLRAPYISLFLHWVGGTLFMFGFASMLSHGRKQLRRGVFFFVRDPQDPTFQPVREIIDRGTGAQLIKIGASALMYFMVIGVSVGLTLQTIRICIPGTLPLQWKPSQPLSQIPIDLLALHFIGPPAIKFLRPHRRFRKLIEKWWSYSVTQLRLGNYFFGPAIKEADAQIEAEVDTPIRLALDKVVRVLAKFAAKDAMRGSGGLVRVPNSDTLTLPSKKRVFVLVTRAHEPIDQTEMDLLVEQNKKAIGDGRNPLEDFCVVYLPPFIRCRTFMLLFSLWVSLVVLVGASLSVPLVIGRFFFDVVLEKEVHDGYSFAAGGIIALCNFLASRSLLRKIRRWSQAERVRKTSLLGRIKRNILWGTNIAYLLVCFGLVIPLALSLVFELYVISPLKMGLSASEPAVLFVWELWSMGLLYMHILYTTRRYLPPSSFTRACDRVLFQVAHLQIAEITENLIGPVVALCGVLVALPPLGALLVHPLLGRAEQRATDVRLIYPALALVLVVWLAMQTLIARLAAWRVKLRESEFLVELRLRNLDSRGPHTIAADPGAERQMTPGHLA